jgi:serine protease Do
MQFLCHARLFRPGLLKWTRDAVVFQAMKRGFILKFLTLAVGLSASAAPGWAQKDVANEKPSAALAKSLSTAFADVYEKIAPSVVVIEVKPSAEAVSRAIPPALEYFFGAPDGGEVDPERLPPNQGSGFILTADGYVVTNFHVVNEGGPDGRITVMLRDGRRFPGKLVGMDQISDLAVLKIDAADLPAAELGDSDKVRVGEFAFAIGAPFDLRYSFTFGVIGAKGRTDLTHNAFYEEFLQTDASINPGNSGGPLCDIEGRVVGVNTLIRGVNRGLGFSIPINLARKTAEQLITNGRVSRPWLGIGIAGVGEIGSLSQVFRGTSWESLKAAFGKYEKGVVVTGFEEPSPANGRSGLRVGDVILKVDNVEVASSRDLQRQILMKNVGQEIELDVMRQDRQVKVRLKTGERNDQLMQAANQLPVQRRTEPPANPTAGLEVRTLDGQMAKQFKTSVPEGVVVTAVETGSSADMANIQTGDVITSIGTKSVRNVDEFVAALAEASEDDGVMVNIERGSQKTFAILKR